MSSTTTTIKVDGMTCDGCSSSLQRALAAVDGVSKAEVTREPGQATVTYDSVKVHPARLDAVVEDAGFEVVK
ncbi:heavy-metal-associated domain-containing protein [Kozakia baliensis]|uniref:heavy-metal-associated domain-containing protein n=1 Tax=Kozakia baliensis TaxID=153496 RepID=UPI00055B8249|nr:heavy-metal-associated domain-containing protein [Kozakia baliensis]AOX18990.1 hypothetical protein A0U90_00230 [Kozakia baliensis]